MSSKQPVCNECLKLNLTAFFQSEDVEKYPWVKKHRIPIKRPEKQPEQTGCVLCNILSRSTFTTEHLSEMKTFKLDQKSYELRAIAWGSVFDNRYSFYSTQEKYLLVLIIFPSLNQEIQKEWLYTRISYLTTHRGFAILERTSEGKEAILRAPPNRFNAQQSLTLSRIPERESWYNMQNIPDLYLIDCHKLTVVAATMPLKYVALSYVWSSPSTEDTAHCSRRGEDNMTLLLPENLPLVITDAITVTKSVGFRYLWVDKFCINQRQPDVKHKQIAQMDAVYSNSELTIIAAAGQDENHGLPGVSSCPRAVTLVAELEGSRVLWFQNPQDLIQKSKWNTRGWTYQEAFLAQRRLVFLDDQIYFECDIMLFCETILWPHYMDLTKPIFCEQELKTKDAFDIFYYLGGIIGEYTARELRYDKDSLFAIAAGLCWEHVHNCWESSGKPRRRFAPPSSVLPSWTWAGWAGQVVFRTVWHSLVGNTIRVRQFWLEDEDGYRSTVDTVAESDLNTSFPYRILVIETWAVPPDKIQFQEMPDGSVIWNVHGHEMERLNLSEGPGSEVELAKELKKKGGRWRCILLGNSPKNPVLLILRQEVNEDLWVRVGVMLLARQAPTGWPIGNEKRIPNYRERKHPTEEFRIK
ncbi:HET-domain-containing protein [Annulohypoxylon bovei var. microspora]|nr:HET-domain-containing protein [Annulohypoxylon bovei var. microspora]